MRSQYGKHLFDSYEDSHEKFMENEYRKTRERLDGFIKATDLSRSDYAKRVNWILDELYFQMGRPECSVQFEEEMRKVHLNDVICLIKDRKFALTVAEKFCSLIKSSLELKKILFSLNKEDRYPFAMKCQSLIINIYDLRNILSEFDSAEECIKCADQFAHLIVGQKEIDMLIFRLPVDIKWIVRKHLSSLDCAKLAKAEPELSQSVGYFKPVAVSDQTFFRHPHPVRDSRELKKFLFSRERSDRYSYAMNFHSLIVNLYDLRNVLDVLDSVDECVRFAKYFSHLIVTQGDLDRLVFTLPLDNREPIKKALSELVGQKKAEAPSRLFRSLENVEAVDNPCLFEHRPG